MSLDAHLIHRCTIERDSGTKTDAYGNHVPDLYEVDGDVPCRFVEKLQRVLVDDGAESAVITTYLLLVAGDADLLPRDVISRIRLEDGTVLERTFTVAERLVRRSRFAHHIAAKLEAIH